MSTDRYDLVIFGATGFTGEFVVEEVALTVGNSKSWAVSGRNGAKLEETLAAVGKRCGLELSKTPIIVADVEDPDSLAIMAKKARVVINCVGPYRFFGEPVVKACVENGANHVDISGEPQYLEKMQLKYGEQAKEAGVYIIGACGWDCIPIETGLIFARKNFEGDLFGAETVAELSTGPKGTKIHTGTFNSMIHGFAHRDELKPLRQQLFPDRLPRSQFKLPHRRPLFYHEGANGYCMPFLGADKSVVTRTQYFNFNERKWRPLVVNCLMKSASIFQAIGLMIFGVIFAAMASFSATRKLLEKYPELFSFGYFSHDGPTREQLAETRFSYWIFARGWKDKTADPLEEHSTAPDSKLTVRVDGPDPGYGATSVCLVSSAVTILDEHEKLPGKGGVMSPGAAFAETNIIDRLNKRGVTFTVVCGTMPLRDAAMLTAE